MKKLLLILTILIVSSYGVSAKNYKGRCGANLKWQYLSDSRTLYITGTGMMDDYGVFDEKNKVTPWERFESHFPEIHLFIFIKTLSVHARD